MWKNRTHTKRFLRIITVPAALFLLLFTSLSLPRSGINTPSSTVIEDRHGRILRVYLSTDESYHIPVPLSEMSPHLKAAFITFEDRFFYRHPGLNPVAIGRAIYLNVKAGEVVTGGSTITQQLARMLDPRPRTLFTKTIEAIRAIQLELQYSKDEILTAYLNQVPFGGNIVGVEAASWIYFSKPAKELGPGEAALLAAIPQSPERLRPDRFPSQAKERRDEVLRRMLQLGEIDQKQHDRALLESTAHGWKPFPLHAPHLCDDLHARRPGGHIRSSIDLDLQTLARGMLEDHMEHLRDKHISNGAVVILENSTGAVRALAGSADYFDTASDGQVNGVRAERSPGSTLKPFVYALAIDDGLLAPANMLEDIPVRYSGYEPQNYDETFRGMVTARHALTQSLNVPAVNTLQQVGLTRFMHLLQQGGIRTLKEGPDHYGLPLILGGAGIRLLELTNLYAMLSRMGEYLPYRLQESQQAGTPKRLLSEGAAYLLTEMLTEVQRPDFPPAWERSLLRKKIAWKTGTSYGHRDAWSVGYNPDWTIGVWIGNFSGEGAPDLVGSEASGPLLFDLFNAMPGEEQTWYPRPEEIGKRQVCAISGMPPGPGCRETVEALYHKDYSPRTPCTFHTVCEIDNSSGHRLCPLCRPGRDYHEKVVLTWPPRIASWRMAMGIPVERLPRHKPDCTNVASSGQPEIHSPDEDVTYVIRKYAPLQDQQILLDAAFDSDVATVYWFVNQHLVYEGPPGRQVFWRPERGQHQVVCMDDEGRRAVARLTVQ